jgi:hypothetical protein
MKKIIILYLFLFLLKRNITAQTSQATANPVLDKFVGTWVAHQGEKTITITFNKAKILLVNKDVLEVLVGYHILKNGNNIIENSDKPTLINGSNISEDGVTHDDEVNLGFHDNTKNKGGMVTITLAKGNPKEFTFSLYNTEGTRFRKKGDKEIDWTFTLPTHLIFKKLE